MTASRRATMGLLAASAASLLLAGCASTGDLDTLGKRVDGLESQHTTIDGRLDAVESRVTEAEAKADQAIARAEAAEREAADAAARADDAARRADAMFKKSVSK